MRILTPATAASHGVTRHQLLGPRFRRLFHGVYVDAEVKLTLQVLVAAARVVVPHGTVTGVTALRLRGASPGADSPIWLATTTRVRREGIVCLPRAPTGPVASLVQAFADADLRLTDEVVTLDELRRMSRIQPAEADDLAAHRPHAWSLSVPNSGSVRESRTRMILHTAGLPAPVVQFTVVTPDDRFVGRVDCAWPEYRVILEYEGQQHFTDTQQWDSDIKRYELLERLGWTVIRVTAAGLRDPVALVGRVEQALRAGGWRGRPPVLGAAWLAEVA